MDEIIYKRGSPLEEKISLATLVAKKNCPVFLNGESGSGKEVFAKLIHWQSHRVKGPLITLNCSAIPPALFESELFGHKKGAFTGAFTDKIGKITHAQAGTLFLDEIGDMPLSIQTKLLRVLQEKKVCPLGSNEEMFVDFRLITATHKNLRSLIREKLFREDLFFRINVMEIIIPPLRERPGDIEPLISFFLKGYYNTEQIKKSLLHLPNFYLKYSWPGNIRELKNTVDKYVIYRELGKSWEDSLETPEHLGDTKIANTIQTTIKNSRHTQQEVLEALNLFENHRQKTADYLGITRRALQYRLANFRTNNHSQN